MDEAEEEDDVWNTILVIMITDIAQQLPPAVAATI